MATYDGRNSLKLAIPYPMPPTHQSLLHIHRETHLDTHPPSPYICLRKLTPTPDLGLLPIATLPHGHQQN